MKKTCIYKTIENSSPAEKLFQKFLVFVLFVVVAFTDKPEMKSTEQANHTDVKSDIINLTEWQNDQFSGIISLYRFHLKESE
jgi:hypothetical protein